MLFDLANRFAEALHRTEGEDRSPEGGIRIIPAEGPPAPQRSGPRPDSRSGPRPGGKPNRPVLVRALGPQGRPTNGPPAGPSSRPGPRAGPSNPTQRGKFRQG